MLYAILNKCWKQYLTKQQLYDHLLPISQIIQVRWVSHFGHCWRRKNKLISDVLRWTPTHGHTSVSQPAKTYIHQLCADIGCCLEDLPRVIDCRGGWREEVKRIRAISTDWWRRKGWRINCFVEPQQNGKGKVEIVDDISVNMFLSASLSVTNEKKRYFRLK